MDDITADMLRRAYDACAEGETRPEIKLMTLPPLCKDCRYARFTFGSHGCMLNTIEQEHQDAVTGEVRPARYASCYAERDENMGSCGPSGKLFEAKTKPWWRFW